jgi:SAM-dependent methyltransferase
VLFVVTLCFIDDPLAALLEANRVLRADGGLVLGLVLAEGAWGQHYQRLGAQGHPYYQRAHFFTRPELTALLAQAGLSAVRTRSALLQPPEVEPAAADAREGDDPAAGFTAILATIPNATGRRAASAPSTKAEASP